MEIWKDVKGYEGHYKVSSLGRVKSLKREVNVKSIDQPTRMVEEKILKQTLCQRYLSVRLSLDGKMKMVRVHRLVISAFIENIDNKPQINHKNGNRIDNRIDNLEWCTGSENMVHAYSTGLQKTITKPIMCIDTQMIFESSFKAAEYLNNTKFSNTKVIKRVASAIRRCARKQCKISYGYRWKYID